MQPRGGGAFIAEVDGNLTTSKSNGMTILHWQGKFRGPEFAPVTFQLNTVTSEHLKDSKGRPIPTVVAKYLSEAAQEEIERSVRGNENRVLELYASPTPPASLAKAAVALGWRLRSGPEDKMKVKRAIKALCNAKLMTYERGAPAITDKGRKVIGADATTGPADADD